MSTRHKAVEVGSKLEYLWTFCIAVAFVRFAAGQPQDFMRVRISIEALSSFCESSP